MNKKFFPTLMFAVSLIAVAVLWVYRAIMNDPEFTIARGLSVTVLVFSSINGITLILTGLFSKTLGVIKKLMILLGGALIVVAFIALIGLIAIPDKMVLPVVGLIVAVVIFISFVAVGFKKWDTGDNQKVGYKNYYERKKEEEKKNDDN